MRDAAGDSGEFYTPRPLVRFMVEVTNPRLGETSATGTGSAATALRLPFEAADVRGDGFRRSATVQAVRQLGGDVLGDTR